ncbi:MAG TPA: aminotransferase class I/II-fold pyridoxal phosphate-dependent enzyme [Gemmatimonadaceae bacterium]|nr:aminotransferase class I/II-fold pyridoxal phosphate-dependent enzyme [Gemmatimonadaceae bacterium]
MPMDVFAMERMQSTWENVVECDMSESGIHAVTLGELVTLGLDLPAMLETPLGYSQSNGTPPLRERIAALYPGATPAHVEVTNGTSEANYIVALSQLSAGDRFAMEMPNYMQLWGVPRSLGAVMAPFHMHCGADGGWTIDWEDFERAVTPGTKLVYITNPNNPTGAVLSSADMHRLVARCEDVGAYLVADEVYQGSEYEAPLTRSFWGLSDRVIVTSGLSKAYGIPGVRIGWIVGPPEIVAQCWAQHDYITISPSRLSDAIAHVAVGPAVRRRLYDRTRVILQENRPVVEAWVHGLNGLLAWTPPPATAMGFMHCGGALAGIPSEMIATHLRESRSVLIVPGSQLGAEGYLRIWIGATRERLEDGLARIARGLEEMTAAAGVGEEQGAP